MARASALRRLYSTAALGFSLAACGGGIPLFHGAHTLPQGTTATGVGFSGTFTAGSARDVVTAVRAPDPPTSGRSELLAEDALIAATLAPQIAPFIGMRVGMGNDNEAGLSFTGRSLRGDARHAFETGPWALSVGAGVIGSWTRFSSELDSASGAVTANPRAIGFDVPILFGWRSDAGVVSLWAGARGGYERIWGAVTKSPPDGDVSLHFDHWRAGGVAGLTIGLRHIHAGLELETAYHGVSGELGRSEMKLNGVTLTPAGGLRFTF